MPIYTYYDYLENYYDVYNDSNSTYNEITPEWTTNLFNPILFSISVICAILAIIILSFTIYKLCSLHKRNRLTTKTSTIFLLLCCLTLHVIQNIIDPVRLYTWYISFNANGPHNELDMAWDVWWCLSKVSLYIVFMWRYYAVFTAASMKSRSGKLRLRKYIMFGSFIAAILLQMALILAMMLFYYEKITGEFDSRRKYLEMSWSFLAGDIVLIAVLGYLLTRAIFKFIVDVDANGTSPAFEAHPAPSVTSKVEKELTGYMESTRTSMHSSPALSLPNDDEAQKQTAQVTLPANASGAGKVVKEKKKRKKSRSKDQEELIYITTRLAVTCIISLLSSVVYQIVWLLAEELYHHDLWLLAYTWSIDAVINMLCVYLSMAMAHQEYKFLCVGLCKCHQCVLCCLYRLMDHKAIQKRQKMKKNQADVEKEMEMTI